MKWITFLFASFFPQQESTEPFCPHEFISLFYEQGSYYGKHQNYGLIWLDKKSFDCLQNLSPYQKKDDADENHVVKLQRWSVQGKLVALTFILEEETGSCYRRGW